MAMVQTSQFDIGVPIWTSPKTIVGPSVNFAYLEGVGTDLGLGLFLKRYGSDITSDIAPFFSLRGGVLFDLPEEGENSTDVVLGTGYGADYFPHDKVSLGVEAQLNFTKASDTSGRFVLPGAVTLNTAAVISLSIYF